MYMYCNGKPIKVYSLVAVYIIILLKVPCRDSSGRYCRDICGLSNGKNEGGNCIKPSVATGIYVNYPLHYWYFWYRFLILFKDKSKIKYWDKSSTTSLPAQVSSESPLYDATQNWKYAQELQGFHFGEKSARPRFLHKPSLQ